MADKPNRGPAIDAGRLLYISPSALNKFHDCERAYWFKYGPMRLPDPSGPAAELGVEIHGRIENYLKGKGDVLGRVERKAIHLMPKPLEGPEDRSLLIEHLIDGGLDAEGVRIAGGVDLIDLRGDAPVVTDWKTKSGAEAYRDEQLLKGPYKKSGEWLADWKHPDGRQMLIYAEWVRRNAPKGADGVTLRHVYIPTKGSSKPFEMSVWTPFDIVQKSWSEVVRLINKSVRPVAAAREAGEVKPNLNHCRKYRKPCPFMAHCPEGRGGQSARFQPRTEGVPVMSMLAKMKSLTTPGAVPATPPPPVPTGPTPPTSAQVLDPSPTSLRIWNVGGFYKLDDGAVGRLEGAPEGNSARFLVNPWTPSASWRDALLSTVGEEVPAPAVAAVPEREQAAPEAPQVAQNVPSGNTDAPKAKRGRPSKAELEARKAAETTPPPTVPTVAQEVAEKAAVETTPAPAGFKLYFGGAYPVGVVTSTLHGYVEALEKAILEQLKPDPAEGDIRIIKDNRFTYGGWKAILAMAAKNLPPPAAEYLVTTGDERIEVVAEALAGVAGAGNVVRGGGR